MLPESSNTDIGLCWKLLLATVIDSCLGCHTELVCAQTHTVISNMLNQINIIYTASYIWPQQKTITSVILCILYTIFVFLFTYICLYFCICILYTHTHTHTHAHTRTHTHTCTHTHTHTHTHTGISYLRKNYMNINICKYFQNIYYICVLYIHKYIKHTHTHTHTHTHIM